MDSTLDEEPFEVELPGQEKDADGDDSEASSDDEDDEEVNVKKRFDEIAIGLRDSQLDLRDPTALAQFVVHNASYLGQKTTGDSDHSTLLHVLVEDAKDKVFDKYQPLVNHLVNHYPNLLSEKDGNEKTALYTAISKKRDKLVRLICDAHPQIANVLNISCYHSENCLHVAVRRNVSPKLAIFLIERASPETLCAKDDKGNTPLNLAVDYERCTHSQLEIVQALILRCDNALDVRTNAPDFFSPYRYHEHTRANAKRPADAEVKKPAREAEKTTAQGRRDDAGPGPGNGPGDAASGKFGKLSIGLGPGGPSMGGEMIKIRPLMRVNTGSEAPYGKYPSGSATPLNIKLAIPTGATGPGGSDGNPSRSNPSKTPRESGKKKRDKEESKVTEESAGMVRSLLKLHCMRTRDHDNAVDFLYGRNQENQIFFDLYDSASLTFSEDRIEEGLAHLKFEDVLQYVALPRLEFEKKPVSLKFGKRPAKPDGNGRSDMIFLFNFLRNKGVKRIIRVIVDDIMMPAHSDEAIEKALGGLKVEIWDWRKLDISTETIATAAPDTTEVCLYWGGNNSVLRGWSEPGGLKQLGKLKKVHLHIEQGLDSAKRTASNVRDFHARLKILCPNVEIEDIEDHRTEKHDPSGMTVDNSQEQFQQRHRWLTCMDEFADFIQNVESPLPLDKPVTIALIDDGIDINEQSLSARIIGGRSFCQRDTFQNLSKPYYVTSGGHGTVMASLICRVCPKAQLYIVKLDEHISEHSKRQITAKSAAKAVRVATDMKVNIISMSWTIESTPQNAEDIHELELAIEAAAKAGILMFCAASDQGITPDNSYPAACSGTKHLFKIGAAEPQGTVWKWVGNPADVDFIFPGHNVVKERPKDAPIDKCRTLTGSSVATAIASGLAALILYCVQLGAVNAQALNPGQGRGSNTVTMEDFEAIKGHERMREAFLAIGTSPASLNKYVEVWGVFGPAVKKADGGDQRKRIDTVIDLAVRLKTTRIFE